MEVRAVEKSSLTKNQQQLHLQMLREVMIISLQPKVTFCLLALFIVNTLSVLALVYLNALGKATLSQTVLLTLIGQTIAQSAGVFFWVVRHLFPSSGGLNNQN
jgi:uncharacterized membrane protein